MQSILTYQHQHDENAAADHAANTNAEGFDRPYLFIFYICC